MRKTTEEAARRQLGHGLPGEFLHNARLMLAATTRTLVLHFALERNGTRIPHLFLRDLDAARYTSVFDYAAPGTPSLTLEHGIRGVRSPTLGPGDILYFLLTEHGTADGRAQMNVVALARMELSSRSLAYWALHENGLAFVPIDLLGADDRGVYAKAGIATPVASDMGRGHTVDYSIVHFRWRERSAAALAEMPFIFY